MNYNTEQLNNSELRITRNVQVGLNETLLLINICHVE